MMKSRRCTSFADRACRAFTLAELLISVGVLALLILLVAGLMNSATAITRTGNKHIDTDTQARAILDRMALDFGRMLKRTDVDYYIKEPSGKYKGHGNGHGYGKKLTSGQQLNDQIAFFTQAPGYYASSTNQSPVSLVAYRVNNGSSTSAPYLKLERMAKGLLWNGVSGAANIPVVFLPLTIDATWPAAAKNDNSANSRDINYEMAGLQVFRFEYYYLLKNGRVTDVPWDKDARPTQTSLTVPVSIGLADVQAIAVAIAVIDPVSRSLIPQDSLFEIADDMDDFKTAPGRGVGGAKKIGDMEVQWNTVVQSVVSNGHTFDNSPVPPEAAKAIRIYNRYFDLRNF